MACGSCGGGGSPQPAQIIVQRETAPAALPVRRSAGPVVIRQVAPAQGACPVCHGPTSRASNGQGGESVRCLQCGTLFPSPPRG
jgi:hypothetical protein